MDVHAVRLMGNKKVPGKPKVVEELFSFDLPGFVRA
jgi:hypothetical protein